MLPVLNTLPYMSLKSVWFKGVCRKAVVSFIHTVPSNVRREMIVRMVLSVLKHLYKFTHTHIHTHSILPFRVLGDICG